MTHATHALTGSRVNMHIPTAVECTAVCGRGRTSSVACECAWHIAHRRSGSVRGTVSGCAPALRGCLFDTHRRARRPSSGSSPTPAPPLPRPRRLLPSPASQALPSQLRPRGRPQLAWLPLQAAARRAWVEKEENTTCLPGIDTVLTVARSTAKIQLRPSRL